VLVEGKAQSPRDGGITLKGALGSVHRVAIERGERRAEVEVILTERGAKPNAIEAPIPPRTAPAPPASVPSPPVSSGHVGATTNFN
jgi:hypothetical protein